MYEYGRMRTYSLDEALFLQKLLNSFRGYFWCYPDNSEEEILMSPSRDEIIAKYDREIFLGTEDCYDPLFIELEGVLIEEDMSTEELALILNGGGVS